MVVEKRIGTYAIKINNDNLITLILIIYGMRVI